jgi:hypothetical protein
MGLSNHRSCREGVGSRGRSRGLRRRDSSDPTADTAEIHPATRRRTSGGITIHAPGCRARALTGSGHGGLRAGPPLGEVLAVARAVDIDTGARPCRDARALPSRLLDLPARAALLRAPPRQREAPTNLRSETGTRRNRPTSRRPRPGNAMRRVRSDPGPRPDGAALLSTAPISTDFVGTVDAAATPSTIAARSRASIRQRIRSGTTCATRRGRSSDW